MPMHRAPFRDLRRMPSAAELAALARLWRGVWLILTASQRDALAADVARVGQALRAAVDARDSRAAFAAVQRMHQWLEQLGGTLMSRLMAPFDRLV